MRNFIKGGALLLASTSLLAVSAMSAQAQNFSAVYNPSGQPGTQVSQPVTSGAPAGATIGDIVRVGITPNAGLNSINSAGWTQAFNLNAYYGVTITPSIGNSVNLTTLTLSDQRSGTGPTSFAIRSSANNFTTDLFTYSLTTATTSSQSFNLGSVAALQGFTGPAELRIYGFNGTSTTGTGTYRLTAFGISGTVNAVTPPVGGGAAPEPGSLALVALGALPLAGVVAARRRRKAA
ncbi:MAG: PEP-CTERM sorting domain-containing protein [Cytophagales bacterium]|nr:PEP-CTERM sorting domain-containing protein [Armatimonadota bacterium]